jgi:hypothetical protein
MVRGKRYAVDQGPTGWSSIPFCRLAFPLELSGNPENDPFGVELESSLLPEATCAFQRHSLIEARDLMCWT